MVSCIQPLGMSPRTLSIGEPSQQSSEISTSAVEDSGQTRPFLRAVGSCLVVSLMVSFNL